MHSPSRPLATDLLLDPFDVAWDDFSAVAQAARDEGFDGLWTWDHLAGQVHQAQTVLECWTALAALAGRIPDLAIGPLVLNVANRDPRMLAGMAATLQEVTGGRLLLGLGAGGGRMTPYASEQHALGRTVAARPSPPRLADLLDAARSAHAKAGRDPTPFLVTVFAGLESRWLDEQRPERTRLRELGVDRLVLIVSPAKTRDIRDAGRLLRR